MYMAILFVFLFLVNYFEMDSILSNLIVTCIETMVISGIFLTIKDFFSGNIFLRKKTEPKTWEEEFSDRKSKYDKRQNALYTASRIASDYKVGKTQAERDRIDRKLNELYSGFRSYDECNDISRFIESLTGTWIDFK